MDYYLNTKQELQTPDYILKKINTPTFITVKNNKLIKAKFLASNNSSFNSDSYNGVMTESKLMREVNEILKNKNTIELVRTRLNYSSNNESTENLIDLQDPKIKIKYNIITLESKKLFKRESTDSFHVHSSLIKDYDIAMPNRSQQTSRFITSSEYKNRCESGLDSVNSNEVETPKENSESIKQGESIDTMNGELSGLSAGNLSKQKNLKYSSFFENANTDDSSDHYTASTSSYSFRNTINSSNLSIKSKSRTKKVFYVKHSNEAARKYFRHKLENKKMDRITELVQDTFKAPSDSDKLVFNKDYYKAKKETDVSKDMQYALTIPPEARTYDQIKFVRNGLLKLEAFAEYPLNMQEKICKCAFYQKVPAKRVIIRQGQVADSFYFIISGQAMVTVLDEDKKTGEIKNRIVAVLRDGTCFGELAFLYNTTRTATVTSLTNMELLSIGREDFYDIFMSNRGQEPEHIKFLRECAFIKDWPIHVLLENPSSCVFHYYKRGQVIVQNSLKCDYIYIVKTGSCQVLKKLNEVKPNRLLLARATKESILADSFKSKIDTGLHRERHNASIPWSFTDVKHVPKSNTPQPDPKPLFLQVQLLKPGETFGLSILKFDETDHNVPNPELSLISNGSEVLMLKKDIFLRYANEKVRKNVRHLLQPYPSTNDMQKKLQTAADWNYYKSKHMKEFYANLKSKEIDARKLKV